MHVFKYSFGLFCLLSASICAAQMSSASDDLQPVKMDITDRILEHGRLQKDNDRLRLEFAELKAQYDQHLKKLQISGEEEKMKTVQLQKQLDTRSVRQKSPEELDADMMIRQTQIAHLKVALMDLEEQEHLWKLKFTDAEYQKQTLELELAAQQNHYEQQAGEHLSRVDQLNRAILRNRVEEKELLVQYALLEDEANILDHQQKIFDNENAYLKKEAIHYQGLYEKTKNEADSSEREETAAREKLSQTVEEKQKKKADLEQQLETVRQRQKSLDDQLTQTLKTLEERERLTSDIMRLKQDNERLRSTIAGLQSQAQNIKP